MKFSLFVSALAGVSSVSAFAMPWGNPKPTKTLEYPWGPTPTPTPTPSGHPKPGHPGDKPKPKHKVCVKGLCFAEPPKNCQPGYTPGMHKKCHTCCKEAGGEHPKRNMGQAFAESE